MAFFFILVGLLRWPHQEHVQGGRDQEAKQDGE
jgi:hypothetical protein